jgi:hypothetical protein
MLRPLQQCQHHQLSAAALGLSRYRMAKQTTARTWSQA